MLVVPFFSEKSREICIENRVSYVDLIGNIYLNLPNSLIDIVVPDTPRVEKRSFQSLFRPKAASILRTMFREPKRSWRVTALAAASKASLGHVSNVRQELLRREWVEETDKGIALVEPSMVLDAWRDVYQMPKGILINLYTPFHGEEFLDKCREVFTEQDLIPCAAFGSYSAAQWIAPYVRTGTEYFYATPLGADRIQEELSGSRPSAGTNVSIRVLDDTTILYDTIEPTSGIICTSHLQTYLDLAHSGERGTEAAEHLRRQVLTWDQ